MRIKIVRNLAHAGWILTLIVISAEVTSRVEDRVRRDIGLLDSPDFDSSLMITTRDGERQGRPHGQFGKFSMNSFGFRGPEIIERGTEDSVRVVLVGSSETFGVFESPKMDYPEQLRRLLRSHGDFQVFNTALPGMTPKSAIRAFDNRFAQLEPHLVVIYLSPLFELNKPPPSLQSSIAISSADSRPALSPANKPSLRLRILQRIRDSIDKPEYLQRILDRRKLERQRAAIGESGLYANVPMEYVDQHLNEIDKLVTSVRNCGAQPILLTHSIETCSPPTKHDLQVLESFLVNIPRATPEVILQYEAEVRQRLLNYGKEHGIPVIDLAEKLNGKSSAFGDLVHFSDEGAEVVAKSISEEILRWVKPTPGN